MFVPEAYITATRQFVAQANNWSLEELALEVFAFCLVFDQCAVAILVFVLQPSEPTSSVKNLVEDRTYMPILVSPN